MKSILGITLACTLLAVGAVVAAAVGDKPVADNTAHVLIEAQFVSIDGVTTNSLKGPSQVETLIGKEASMRTVTEHFGCDLKAVETGFILTATPNIEKGILTLRGSACFVNAIEPDFKRPDKNVDCLGFRELKITFSAKTDSPDKQHLIGPLEIDGNKYAVWLSARQLVE